jgi:hypothetical protein
MALRPSPRRSTRQKHDNGESGGSTFEDFARDLAASEQKDKPDVPKVAARGRRGAGLQS